MARLALAFVVVLACACTSERAAIRQSLDEGVRVEVTRTLWAPPESGDGAPLVEVRVTGVQGDEHLFAPVLGGVPWEGGAMLLGRAGDLSFGDATGARRPLDANVTFVPVVSPRGDHAVYAASEDGLSFSLVSRAASERVTLAEGLASIGAVRFVDDVRFVFVAGRPGGVAGLFTASTSSPRLAVCLTNCALRTGQPWGDAFVPLPSELESFSLEGDVLSYSDASGAMRTVALPGAAS